jgi:hypothetical protein
VPNVKKIRGLNLPDPHGPVQACSGTALLGEDHFGFRRGKETREATGVPRIISERTLEIDDELCVCFTEWQEASEHVKLTNECRL